MEVYLGEKLFRNKSPKKNSSAGPPLTRLKREEREKEREEGMKKGKKEIMQK